MVCSFLFSSLPMVQPSHAYVIIGMMMASTICHIACIFIPLNSLLPVSEMILAVAPFLFLSISAIWSDRLPLLFRISPRYSYVGTSSSSSPFSFRELFFPFPLFITLHFAAPNCMWYLLATWLVTSSISCSFSRSWWIRHTSSIHRSESRVMFACVTYPRFLCLSSLAISSISDAYSITDSTPPCLILSLICIFLVSPCLVCILAVRLELRFLAATKQLYKWYFPSVCLSVCHTFFTMFPSSYHHEIFMSYYHGQKWCPCKRSRSEVKGQGHRGQHPT